MASIKFKQVTKKFDNHTVIEDMDLEIDDGSFTVLVGPSGCGKTTLLRMIAGIGPQTSGEVQIDGKDVTKIAPGERDVAMVFQNYAIYPTMSVRENIEFGLKNRKVAKEVRTRLVEEACEKLGMKAYLDRKPSTLSGGQRQRVALARAMVKDPSVFLMDEPLSNLDAKLRVQMRGELIELHHKLKSTFVYVTHDQVEAMSMADTIVLMRDGKIMQQASPSVIYKDPDNLFTAKFIGSPEMNIKTFDGEGNMFGFRPEKGVLSREQQSADVIIRGTIITREMLGTETHYSIRDEDGEKFVVKTEDENFVVGEEVCIAVERNHLYFFGKDEQRVREKDAAYAGFLEKVRRIYR